jgi:hypothetical protein
MTSFSKESISQTFDKFREGLKHAFAVRPEQEVFTLEDVALLDRVADAVVKRGIAAPATLFLESLGPMNFLGSQALHFFTPIIDLAFNAKEVEQVAHLLERRDTISRLIAIIEARTASKGAAAR